MKIEIIEEESSSLDCISDKTFFDKVLKQKKVVVACCASWCGPCKKMTPHLENIQENYNGIKFVKLDVEECNLTNDKLGIERLPTLLLFKNGQIMDKYIGYKNESELIDILDDFNRK